MLDLVNQGATGGPEFEKEKGECHRENRALFELLRDRKVCGRAVFLSEAWPGTEMAGLLASRRRTLALA